MTNQNFDGIRKQKLRLAQPKVLARPPAATKAGVRMDGISKSLLPRKKLVPTLPSAKVVKHRKSSATTKTVASTFANYNAAAKKTAQQFSKIAFAFGKTLYLERRVPVLAAVVALLLAFGGGVYATLATARTWAADSQTEVLATTTPPGSLVLPGAEITAQDGSQQVSNQVLFNTPIEYLKNYFDSINQPDIINTRQIELTQFLKDMHSPLVPAAQTIAEQSHWQLILAIAFAESTLGKNCTDYNCSNIGVAPSSPAWHKYDSYDAWVTDFNRLLDKKYNNWTLEQMCGVYVQPCSDNWLQATQEILDALKDRGIQ